MAILPFNSRPVQVPETERHQSFLGADGERSNKKSMKKKADDLICCGDEFQATNKRSNWELLAGGSHLFLFLCTLWIWCGVFSDDKQKATNKQERQSFTTEAPTVRLFFITATEQ